MGIFNNFITPMTDVFEFKDIRIDKLPLRTIGTSCAYTERFVRCQVNGHIINIPYNVIFDENEDNLLDIFKKISLEGDFDGSLPMYKEEDLPVVDYENLWWSTYSSAPDTRDYWGLVKNKIIKNLERHLLPGNKVKIHGRTCVCGEKDVLMIFTIELNKLGKFNCKWPRQNAITDKREILTPLIQFVVKILKK